MSEKTYTEAELAAAIEQAKTPLEARVQELESSQQVSEHEAALATLRAEKDAELAELQKELDRATVEAAAEKSRADTIVAWLDEEKTTAEAREAAAARKDERLAKVKEIANVSQDFLDKHGDRLAAMADEDFEAHLDTLRETAAAATAADPTKPKVEDTIPDKTGLHASRDNEGGEASAVKGLLANRRDRGRTDFTTV